MSQAQQAWYFRGLVHGVNRVLNTHLVPYTTPYHFIVTQDGDEVGRFVRDHIELAGTLECLDVWVEEVCVPTPATGDKSNIGR